MLTKKTIPIVLAFGAIYIIWGSTYLAIAYAIESIPPFLMAGARFLITATILIGWMKIKNIPFPSRKEFIAASISGLLMFVGGNVSVVWAEQYISSGIAAVIVASMPIWFVILDPIQLRSLKTNPKLIIGLILGFFGVAFLMEIDGLNFSSKSMISYLLLIIATLTWALGTLYTRKANHPKHVTSKIMTQLLSSSVVTLGISLLTGELIGFELTHVSGISLFSLGYLIVFGTIIAYYSYIWLIQIKPAAQVGTYTYVNPIIAVCLGWWLRDEIVTPNVLVGLGVILVSIFMINFSFYKKPNLVQTLEVENK